MNHVIICVGLPASGKSTWAKQKIELDPTYVRVNKDEIRAALMNGREWTKQLEKEKILPERDRRINDALLNGMNVIVDDTNFEQSHHARIREIALPYGAQVDVKHFPIAVDEAVSRDAYRENPVGANVIRDMARRYLDIPDTTIKPYVGNTELPSAIICDLDGTLSLFCKERGCACSLPHRSPYDASTCDEDALNEAVADILRTYWYHGAGQTPIILMSGREDRFRSQTETFLLKHAIKWRELHMRTTGDLRKDAVIKRELFDRFVRDRYNVRFVLDDRNQVVDFWRSLGLTCLQVAPGDF